MPIEILTPTELAVIDWLRANVQRLAETGEADGALLLVGQPDHGELLIQSLEDEHHGFRPVGPDAATEGFPNAPIRVWGSLPA